MQISLKDSTHVITQYVSKF